MIARLLRAFFLWLSNRRWLGQLATATPIVRRMPFRFVAGTTLDEAVEAVRSLNADGATATIDVLGEAVDDRDAADRAAAAYVTTIQSIAQEGLDANVSIKLTQMGLDLGVNECIEVLAPVLDAAGKYGIFVRIDMESSDYTERTLDIVSRLRANGHGIGPVIQASLHRSRHDVETLARERVRTRVCKGAYANPPELALQDGQTIRDAFVKLAELLLKADAYPAIATHDPEVIRRVCAFAREHGVGADRFEFQLLYGVRRDLQRQLLADGYRLRVYVPYGVEWYAYFLRRLAERPANVMFVLRSLTSERG